MSQIQPIRSIDDVTEGEESEHLVLLAPDGLGGFDLERLLALYEDRGQPEVLGCWESYPEAVKEVRQGLIVRGVDRRTLGVVTTPAVFAGDSLRAVLPSQSPIDALARAGARVAVFDREPT